MIQLIVGGKGSGKTKKMIDMINDSAKTTPGNIVCIEKSMKLTYDIDHAARLIDVDEYKISGYDMLYGFIAGILAGNYDIVEVYLDGVLKLGNHDLDGLGKLLDELNVLAGDGVKSLSPCRRTWTSCLSVKKTHKNKRHQGQGARQAAPCSCEIRRKFFVQMVLTSPHIMGIITRRPLRRLIMLLDIKKIFGTYDEPVTAALELDLSEEDFPGYTVPGTVERASLQHFRGGCLRSRWISPRMWRLPVRGVWKNVRGGSMS